MDQSKTNPQPDSEDFTVPVTVGGASPKPASAPPLDSGASTSPSPVSLPVAEPKSDMAEPEPQASQSPVFSDFKAPPTEESNSQLDPTPQTSAWAPVNDTQAATAPVDQTKSLAELAAEEEAKNPAPQPQSALHPTKKHGKGRMVIVASLLLLSLAGGAAFAYFQQKDTATPAASTRQTTQPAASDAADPTKTAEDIDASLKKVDDTKEFTENDLSDTSIGL